MSLPRLEPVVLITSAPPGSSSQKRKSREGPSDLSAFISPEESLGNRPATQRRRTMYVSDHGRQVIVSFYLILTYFRIPSSRVEVLLPPLGSWKRRLLDRAGNRRIPRPQHPVSDP